jgi:hypothetical protein
MLIECLIKREEPVTVRDIHGFRYEFKPNEEGRKVCEVNSGEHRSMMLAFPGSYRVYIHPEKERGAIDEHEFKKEWVRLRKEPFMAYVQEHVETFNLCSAAIRQTAIEKWNRFWEPDTKIWPGRI